jgi:hypothetical protein
VNLVKRLKGASVISNESEMLVAIFNYFHAEKEGTEPRGAAYCMFHSESWQGRVLRDRFCSFMDPFTLFSTAAYMMLSSLHFAC